jgi:hypothetical protein
MWTLAELARLGVASIGPELVSPSTRSRLQTLPEGGPRACHFAAFECRLDGRDPRVDVSFCLQGPTARAAVRHWLRAESGANELDFGDGTVRALLKAWGADAGVLTQIGSLWIEVDLEASRQAYPFVYFRPEHAGRFWQREDALRVAPLLEAWAQVCAPTACSGASARSAARLRDCIAALPEGARVLLLAPQVHQPDGAIRMSFRLSADRLIPYLRRIAWPGAFFALEQALHASGARYWALPIQLDIKEGEVCPQLSLEFVQSADNLYAERCEPVLAAFQRAGTCSESTARALLHWRYGAAHGSHESAEGVEKLIDLKLTLDAQGAAQSKAYLGTLGVSRYFQSRAGRSPELSPTPSAADA